MNTVLNSHKAKFQRWLQSGNFPLKDFRRFFLLKKCLKSGIKKRGVIVQEYKINNVTVRIHGEPDTEQIRKATESFLKKSQARRKKVIHEKKNI